MNVVGSFSQPVSSPGKVFHHTCFAMNTRFSMVLAGMDAGRAETLASDVERELRSHEKLMSRFDAESPVSVLNRQAAKVAVQPPEALWEILTQCRDYWKRTLGAFDITQWPLQDLWRQHLRQGGEPPEEAIALARQDAGMHRLQFDEAARTVRFEREGVSIDLGGFGKGFALDRLSISLRAQGVDCAFLSFGESSVAVLGSHPHGPSWPVGIVNMFEPARTVHTFHLQNASLSSSGTAPFNRLNGNRLNGTRTYGPVIDPGIGRPIEGYRTISVASPSGIEAEVLSTALLVTPACNRAMLLSGFSGISAVEIAYRSHNEDFVPEIEWQYGF